MAPPIDTFALQSLARRSDGAVEALGSTHLPPVPQWIGIAGDVYRDRIESVDRRRIELIDAHQTVARALHNMAAHGQRLLDEIRWRTSQRDAATIEIRHLRSAIDMTVDPPERARFEADLVRHLRRRELLQDYLDSARSAIHDLERATATTIDDSAILAPMPSVARKIALLTLPQFEAYKAAVVAGELSDDGLNWTDDGCSDNGLQTKPDDRVACEMHDFQYRNGLQVAGTVAQAKRVADRRLLRDVAADAPPWVPLDILDFPNDAHSAAVRDALLVYLGVHLFGRPNANEGRKVVKKSSIIDKSSPGEEKTSRGT